MSPLLPPFRSRNCRAEPAAAHAQHRYAARPAAHRSEARRKAQELYARGHNSEHLGGHKQKASMGLAENLLALLLQGTMQCPERC